MNVTLRQLRSFITVARYGSFTKGAHASRISQPGLTFQIKELEEAVGQRLLDRNTHYVRLTEAGANLLPALQKVMAELEAALEAVRGENKSQRGVIRIACLPSVAAGLLPKLIATFRKANPLAQFVVRDAPARHIAALVRSEDVEVGISDYELKAVDLDSTVIIEERMHVIAWKGHPITRQASITLADIAEYPLVLTAPATNARVMVDAAFAKSRKVIKPVCEVEHMSTAIAMVEANVGIAILPSLGANLAARKSVESRYIEHAPFLRSISLMKRRNEKLTELTQSFVDILLKEAQLITQSGKQPSKPGRRRRSTRAAGKRKTRGA